MSFMFYIFKLFNIYPSPFFFLYGLYAFVWRGSLCMLYHMHDILFTLL